MPEAATIKIVKGPGLGRVVRLEEGVTLSFGRGNENDVTIDDLDVSRNHCTFAFVRGRVVLTDLNSTNGTFVDGERVNQAILDGKAKIALGTFATQLDFCYGEEEDSAEPPIEPALPERRNRLAQRRAKTRTPCRILVWCKAQDQAFPGVVIDISTGGLSLQAALELPPETVLEVRPQEGRYPAIRVMVRWCDAREEVRRYGTCFADELEVLRNSWVSFALRALGNTGAAPERRAYARDKDLSPPTPGLPPTTGERLGHYELGTLLGEGGSGRVFRAHDPRLLRDVAIKVLISENTTPESLERFVGEARALARISHPGVVTIHEVYTGPPYYIVMELIHGEPLAFLLERGPLSEERALNLIRQVLEALEVVHKAGIVHRDLKTLNIMVCTGDRVKLLDFGLAKLADRVGALTQAGQVWGTPAYMAPEQIDGRYGPIDEQTDLFAAACILYEMLTGRAPFAAPSIPKLIYEILYNEPPDPRELRPDLSEAVVRTLMRCLSKTKENRFQNSREFLENL